MMEAGVRAAFACSSRAAKMMLPRGRGLIVNISYWAAQKHIGNVIYGLAKAATDKMTADMAHELRPHGIAVVSLYPGLVRTEAVLQAAENGWLDLSNSRESRVHWPRSGSASQRSGSFSAKRANTGRGGDRQRVRAERHRRSPSKATDPGIGMTSRVKA